MEPSCSQIWSSLESYCRPLGLETAPLKVGWYNEALQDKRFAFNDLDPDTLAFIVVSSPSMFEKAFIPFVRSGTDTPNPVDECMMHHFRRMCDLFPEEYGLEPLHDFELSPVTRRPKILVQTAAHVASVARFYRQEDLDSTGLEYYKSMRRECGHDLPKKIFPVSLHPKYGGWFGLRGVLIFKGVQTESEENSLKQRDPPEILQSQKEIAELLYLFNDHWQDRRYRDVGMGESVERYSELQQEYFAASTDQRRQIQATFCRTESSLRQVETKNRTL